MSSTPDDNLLRQAAQHFSAGRFDAALAACEQVLASRPRDANALHMKAQLVGRFGRAAEAVELMAQAVSIAPNVAVLQHNYAMALMRAGRPEQAIEALRRAVQLQPDYAMAHYNLGMALEKMRRAPEAIESLRIAARLKSDNADVWNGLGCALGGAGELKEAESALNRALALRPGDATILYNLGRVYLGAAKFDRAIDTFRAVLKINPNHVTALLNLANTLGESGRIDGTIELQRRVVELSPADAALHSNLLLSLHYSPSFSPQQVLQEHVNWAKRHAPPERRRTSYANDRSPERRLRIGYLSPDYNRHPVASFLENVLAGHDRLQVEVFAYSNARTTDYMTARLRGLVDQWRDIANKQDDDAANLIVDDQIDVLIDLAGHTGDNRAPVMARGPAPVQFTYLGYPATTGIPAVQYRITDAVADPIGMTESHHTETLIRLPDCFLCYRPDDDVPPPTDTTPAQQRGHVTFGSFNNFAKITDEMLNRWAAIVQAVPGSHMLFKARALDSGAVRQRVINIFSKYNVDSDRIEMTGWTSYDRRHAVVASADIALDSFPYHGTTTTCETLWLGVPWITLAGTTHVSRVSASILSVIGCPELIANSIEEYSAKAIELAKDLPRLTRYRSMLRSKMQASPLLDQESFVRKLESACRNAWRRWCIST